MIQTVIGEIYHSFTKKELKTLDKYISTSQWRNSETIVKCHECLSHFTSKNKLESLDKEQIFAYVYSGEKYSDTKLRFTFNRLMIAIREHIILTEFESNNIFTQKVWMDHLTEKKLKKNIQYNLETESNFTNSDYKFLFNFFKSQESNFNAYNYNQDIKFRFNTIISVMKNAEIFSDLIFIKNYCALISLTNVYQSIPFNLPLEKFNEIKTKNWDRELPEFDVYLSLIDLLIEKDLKSYKKYKEKLFNNFDIWEDDEKVNLLVYLLNYSTFQINRGNTSFIDELYNLFIYFEDNKIFTIKSYINNTRINNVIHIYLRKKAFEKAENFISKYVVLLEDDLVESCRHFNLARIKFENKFYKDSLRELLQVDFGRDAFYSLNSKYLLLKNYYELKESDALESLCNSFKEYIRKNKVISESHKTSSLNFIKMVNKIYGATKSKAKELEIEISQSTQIAEKNWLIEKIKEKTGDYTG